ncbi:MAG: DUF3127 domain-containing protein [Akkermansiaceae bacterium]
MYETKGNIKWIGETQSFPSGFSKREFVVTTQHDKYPQDLKFEVVKDKCSLLDTYDVGSAVTVSFDIRGNEYNGKYYVNLSCWKLQGDGGDEAGMKNERRAPSANSRPINRTNSPEPSAEELRNESNFDDDDIPF